MLMNILILFATFIGIGVSYYFMWIKHPKKQLGYQISGITGIYMLDSSLEKDLVIKYKNNIVKNLYVSYVTIINEGNLPLENQLVTFTINAIEKYLTYGYTSNFDEDYMKIEAILDTEPNIKKFRIPLLNPGERIFFKFVFADVESVEDLLRVNARAPGLYVHKIEEDGGMNVTSLITTLTFSVMIVLPLLVYLITIFLHRIDVNLKDNIVVMVMILVYYIVIFLVAIRSGLRFVRVRIKKKRKS